MKHYELVVLLHPDLEIDLDKPMKKIEKLISDVGGKIINTDNWGKRKLAYTIAKQEFAIYVYFDIEVEPAQVNKLDQTLNITDEVIRHLLSVHIEPPVKEEKETSEEEKTEEKG